MRRFLCLIGLTASCSAQLRDTPAVPRIPRLGLRTEVVGCYELTSQPPQPYYHQEDLIPFERVELDTLPVIPGSHFRRAYADRSAFARVNPVPPENGGPLFVAWFADSLTDTLTLSAHVGTGVATARVVRTADGGLEGTAAHAWEWGSGTLGTVAWTRRACAGLDLDRRVPR